MLNDNNFDFHKAVLRGTMEDKKHDVNAILFFLCSTMPKVHSTRAIVHIFSLHDLDLSTPLATRDLDMFLSVPEILCALEAQGYVSSVGDGDKISVHSPDSWTPTDKAMDLYQAYLDKITGFNSEYAIEPPVSYIDFDEVTVIGSVLRNRLLMLLSRAYPHCLTRKDIAHILRNKSAVSASSGTKLFTELEEKGYLVSDTTNKIHTYTATEKTVDMFVHHLPTSERTPKGEEMPISTVKPEVTLDSINEKLNTILSRMNKMDTRINKLSKEVSSLSYVFQEEVGILEKKYTEPLSHIKTNQDVHVRQVNGLRTDFRQLWEKLSTVDTRMNRRRGR